MKKVRSRQYLTDADYTDDQEHLANIPAQASSLLYSLELIVRCIGLYMNSDKTVFMRFEQDGTISSLNIKLLKSIDQLTYLGSNISSSKSDVNICIGKVRIAIDR